MKKIICLMLCALAALSVCACDKDNTQTVTESASETVPIRETQAATPDESDVSLKSFIASFDKTPTAEEQVVYEDKDLKITLTGIDYAAISGPGLKFSVESTCSKGVIIQSPYAVVNNYMISPEMNIEVPEGKTAAGTLTLPYFNLAISQITSLQKIGFVLRIVEAKTYEPVSTTDLITVTTSADQDAQPACDDSGQIAYDDNDIKIVLKGVNTDRAYSDGAELLVYLYNGTDNIIAIRTDDVLVNGCEMTSAMNCTILPDKYAADVVTFYTLDMMEYGIDEIDSVKVSFGIKDADNWETIDSTGLISVELKPDETACSTEAEE
ncbi:MAG: hypothetical protein IJG87_07510 [Ruminococcus sp.]|nr:hypothetical protein [Ruminococcus sp.]